VPATKDKAKDSCTSKHKSIWLCFTFLATLFAVGGAYLTWGADAGFTAKEKVADVEKTMTEKVDSIEDFVVKELNTTNQTVGSHLAAQDVRNENIDKTLQEIKVDVKELKTIVTQTHKHE
jgi:hypothetical protein